jgi:hypothetical protein
MKPRRKTSFSRNGATRIRFNTIEECIEDVRLGKMIIVTDDEDRENEGDLVMAAEKVAAHHVNFMVKHGRGLICVPLTAPRLRQLGIPAMAAQNREANKTAFMVSVDARVGITTGISAHDRARTIQVLCDPRSTAEDTFSRCKRAKAASSNARGIPKPPWILRNSQGCSPRASFAKSSTKTVRWRACRS